MTVIFQPKNSGRLVLGHWSERWNAINDLGGRCDTCLLSVDDVDHLNRGELGHFLQALVKLGCRSVIACGAEAEQLHDLVDSLLEDEELIPGGLDVVTTWDDTASDPEARKEAVSMFLLGLGRDRPRPTLLALTDDHGAVLQRELELSWSSTTTIPPA